MKVEQKTWKKETGWEDINNQNLSDKVNLVLAFGPEKHIKGKNRYDEIKAFYPNAEIVISSSVTGILGQGILTDSVVLSAIQFEKTSIQVVEIDINNVKDSFDAGAHLSASLDKDELCGLFILSDSLPLVNGSHLITGVYFNLAEHVPVTGGLASNENNGSALIGLNKPPSKGKIIGIGFSGENLLIGQGVDDGWTPFGTERFVTKSKDNMVYKLDHLTPFEFYTQYLDGLVDDLDTSAMNFPLGLRLEYSDKRIVRLPMTINKDDGSMAFSGDVPEGGSVRMMKTNVSNLIDSAGAAATKSLAHGKIKDPDFSIVVNCVGRNGVLKEWSQEENEAIVKNIGNNTPVLGTYSHGEICRLDENRKSDLQNQSVVVTSFKEL